MPQGSDGEIHRYWRLGRRRETGLYRYACPGCRKPRRRKRDLGGLRGCNELSSKNSHQARSIFRRRKWAVQWWLVRFFGGVQANGERKVTGVGGSRQGTTPHPTPPVLSGRVWPHHAKNSRRHCGTTSRRSQSQSVSQSSHPKQREAKRARRRAQQEASADRAPSSRRCGKLICERVWGALAAVEQTTKREKRRTKKKKKNGDTEQRNTHLYTLRLTICHTVGAAWGRQLHQVSAAKGEKRQHTRIQRGADMSRRSPARTRSSPDFP